MTMNGYVDGELDMMSEGFFDNIEDLLDFSAADDLVESAACGGGGGGSGYQQIVPSFAAAAVFPSTNDEGNRVMVTFEENKICDDINIGDDWITNFLDDSNFDIDFPATPNEIILAAAVPKEELLFQSFSPVSVLEESNNLSSSSSEKEGSSSSTSTSSSSSTNNETADTVSLSPVGPTRMLVPARARSKRPRRATPAHVTIPILPPASEGPPAVPTLLPECESFGESPCPAPPMKKKKKKTLGSGAFGAAVDNAGSDDGMTVRKCQHCGIQKTPQWRAGPMGPKTLCNACGVRYKSGRLFPEYRPAASPTFEPSLHSNSHKKVAEMRIKACHQKAVDGMSSPEYPAAKNCDLLVYIRRRE